jgi:hypothetical protein
MLAMKAHQGAWKDGSHGSNEVGVDLKANMVYWIAFKNVNNYHGTGIEINIM